MEVVRYADSHVGGWRRQRWQSAAQRGPNARGDFEPQALERLRDIGRWMRLHGRAIYGCGASDFTPPPDCRYTKGNRLYLHIFDWPFRHVHLNDMGDKVAMPSCSATPARSKCAPIDPGQGAQNTTMGGLAPNS
ncbi:MAG: hypothetical protein R2911_05285 [Caldilineaceae bacterium]